MELHSQYNDQDIHWKIWGSNLGRSKRIISSPKHPDQLQCPTSLQLYKNHSFFSGSKVARANSLTTIICLEPSLQISGAIPPLNLSPYVANSGTTLFYLHLLPMYISLERSHPFWAYKGTFLYITFPYMHTA
jgi:hypothetical protein